METPESEQKPSITRPEASEDHVDFVGSKGPGVPKIRMIQEESSAVAHRGPQSPSNSPSPAVSPSPTPASSSAPTPVPTPRAGQNGGLAKGTPERKSMGGIPETVSPYINGGIFNKRYSYSGSTASESMDMSINKESISVSSRVSRLDTWAPTNVPCECSSLLLLKAS